MERIFEFLFKYPPLFFEQGDFTFGAPMSVRLWLIIVGILGAATVASYTIARGKSTVTDRGRTEGFATCSHHRLPSPTITNFVDCGPATEFCWDPHRRFTKHVARGRER